jgi:hypothetical protein
VNVTVIQSTTIVIIDFTLVDPRTGEVFARPAGSTGDDDRNAPGATPTTPTTAPTPSLTVPPDVNLGSGDVQVTLLWTSGDDVDLHVVDPTGFELSYVTARAPTQSPSGGQLDHDDTAGCGSAPTTHVENIFWPRGGAPSGTYQAYVQTYSSCGQPASFELRITVRDRVVYDQTSSLPPGGSESPRQSFTA